MNKEDKEILIQDLCARLPYEPIVRCYFVDGVGEEVLDTDDIADLLYNDEDSEFPMYKPYLRSMKSMTPEEIDEYAKTEWLEGLDWLNKHHFDYRGLIHKGLAIEVTKENNPYEN